MTLSTIASAFKKSMPVLFGYFFLGIAFAILMLENNMAWYYAMLMSIFLYAGAMQFALVGLLVAQAPLWLIAVMTLVINLRNLFYGLPFLRSFKTFGWRYPYMIFAINDETFSILYTNQEASKDEQFLIAFFNHVYWVVGTAVGLVVGNALPIDLSGIDFSMTALFIIIVVEQYRSSVNKKPFYIGFGTALGALLVLGSQYFLMVAIALTIVLLFWSQKKGGNAN